MPVEEFNSKRKEFCWILTRIVAFLPPMLLIVSLLFYFIGPYRVTYINEYNRIAKYWNNSGLNLFKANTFFITSSMPIDKFKSISRPSSNQYPVQDTCDKKGDPKDGCLYVESSWFDSTVIVYDGYVKYSVLNADQKEIASFHYNASIEHSMTPKELGCTFQVSECESPCREQLGVWNAETKLCTVHLYIIQTCHRLKNENGKYNLDIYSTKILRQNKDYNVLESDYGGCMYNTNWNSAIYGTEKISQIHVFLRSTDDAYIAASAQTFGCSSISKTPQTNCFGPIRREDRVIAFSVTIYMFSLLIVEVLLVGIRKYLIRFKHRQAILESQQTNMKREVYLLSGM